MVVDVIKGLPAFEHHLIILNGPETLRTELPATCRFLNLGRRSNKEIFKHVKTLRQYIRQQRIHLVHSHLFFPNIIARLSTPRRIPLINSIHIISSLDNYTKNPLALWLEKFTYRRRHHIVAVSQEALNDFDKWVGIKGPSQVLYNFIRDEFFTGDTKTKINTAPLRLVAVGNLRQQKNYPYLIEAFRYMPPAVTLDIFGDGNLQPELQEKIDEYKLPVRLLGSQTNLQRLLPQYDLFVMCSFYEGQPLSLLEAIACGLPAIVSDIPVLREVTGDHALYIDLNDPQDLVRKVKKILCGETNVLTNTKPLQERIAAFARKEIYFQKLTHLYQQKLEPAAPQTA